MKKENLQIGRVPCTLWGGAAARLLLAVHGSSSNREDVPIAILAEEAERAGAQVLSLDLPEHGARIGDGVPLLPETCRADIGAVMSYAREAWKEIDLFACSMGAYFSLTALSEAVPKRGLFLSPVFDMRALIENMMRWAQVTPEQLRQAGHIETGHGPALDWGYYSDVAAHPVGALPERLRVLCGSRDELCDAQHTRQYVEAHGGRITILEGGAHYLHSEAEMRAFRHEAECFLKGETH